MVAERLARPECRAGHLLDGPVARQQTGSSPVRVAAQGYGDDPCTGFPDAPVGSPV